jgi:hypothetical protein
MEKNKELLLKMYDEQTVKQCARSAEEVALPQARHHIRSIGRCSL